MIVLATKMDDAADIQIVLYFIGNSLHKIHDDLYRAFEDACKCERTGPKAVS